MDIYKWSQIVALSAWLLAFCGYIYNLIATPRDMLIERLAYLLPMISYVVLVVALFILFVIPSNIPALTKNLLSKGVYIYGGITLVFKEIIVAIRSRRRN